MVNRRIVLGIVVSTALVTAAPLHAQGTCSLQTVVGTYGAVYSGFSQGLDPSGHPVPLAFIGMFTIHPDGTCTGSFRANFAGNLLPWTPWTCKELTVNRDCTGEISYDIEWPPMSGMTATTTEKVLILEQGRELRTVPQQTAIPFTTFAGVNRRISKQTSLQNRCSPHTVRGTHALQCSGFLPFDGLPTLLPDFGLVMMDVDRFGNVSGTAYTKVTVDYVQMPLTGTVTVSDNCTATLVAQMGSDTVTADGIVLEEGKEFLSLITGPTYPGGLVETATCVGKRMDR